MEIKEPTKHDKYLEALNRKFKKDKEFSGAYLVLYKYVTEWTTTDKKIVNLLNNAYLYDLLKKGKAEKVLEAIEWTKEENNILINKYPHQEEEFNTYLECLGKFEEIVKATVDNGFSYYDGLVANAVGVEEGVDL